MSLFPSKMRAPKRSKLAHLTLRDFGGGLNAVEDDTAMQPTYQPVLKNMKRTASGSLRLRYGQSWFADVNSAVSGTIVDIIYFNGVLVAVTTTGQIATVDGNGVVTLRWNSTIAAALPGAPAGWSSGIVSIDFVPFKRELIIHNGIDKPVTMSSAYVVTYLQDLATSTNIHVPIGLYGCTVANYHCVAGISASPTLIYISSVGTAGTFPGDAAPNDSISVDVGAYAPEGATEIRGIDGFRSNLVVYFRTQSLIIQLGTYENGIHVPKFPDTLPQVGILGHRCSVQIENDLHFADNRGLNSAKRNILSGLIDSSGLGELVEPLYRQSVDDTTEAQQLYSCFLVYDKLAKETTIYFPTGNSYVYSANDKLHYKGWSTAVTPNWTCGCTSILGRVFYAIGSRIFLKGNNVFSGENYYIDRIDDRDANWGPLATYFAGALVRDTITNESYTALVNLTSGVTSFLDDRNKDIANPKWALYTGIPIDFDVELPWMDGRDPSQVKQARYLRLGTRGTARFTVEAYVDSLYKDFDQIVRYAPALSMEFIGNDALGFGYDAGPFGGGRRSNDPRLYAFPLKFTTLKLRIKGAATGPLELVMISLLYSRGRYKR